MIDRLLKDLEINKDKWYQDGSKIKRKQEQGNGIARVYIDMFGDVNIIGSGANSFDHDIRPVWWERRQLKRAVKNWKKQMHEQVFSFLGQ